MLLHAVSALEEAQVKRWVGYLIIAVLRTVLDGTVTVWFGMSIWIARAGNLPARTPRPLRRIGSHFASECMGSVWFWPARTVEEPECQINAERAADHG